MELIRYQKTLDVHKNGIQFTLQGFETADRLSRIIEISLMASGDAIDFPLERIVAMMYVTTPGADEPSINECTIEDNKIIYNVLPITVEGITTMQLKLVETDITGAKRVLAFPKFAVEVGKSNTNDDGEELQTTFSAIEDFIAKAEAAYGSRLEKIELDSECMFRAYYYDGSTYETDILKKLFLNGNVELSKSYAMGGTGVRAGEDTDNSKYYSNVSKSEALNAKAIMEGSEKILEEVKTHGIYTVFKVDFTTGEVEYVSSSHHFNIDTETGELMVFGATGKFEEAVGEKTEAWLNTNKIYISDLQRIAEEHSSKIAELKETTVNHTETLSKTFSIEQGGTGGKTVEEALNNLGALSFERYDYIGNGKRGEDNKNTYTFKRMPKMVMLCGMSDGTNVIFPYGQGMVAFMRYASSNTSRNTEEYLHIMYDGLTMSWYGKSGGSDSAASQFNYENETYAIIGIG